MKYLVFLGLLFLVNEGEFEQLELASMLQEPSDETQEQKEVEAVADVDTFPSNTHC